MRVWAWLFCMWMLVPAATMAATAQSEANDHLAAIETTVWQHMLEVVPEYRQKYGLPLTGFPDVTHAGSLRGKLFYERILRELEALNEDELTANNKLTAGILRREARLAIDGYRFHFHMFRGIPYSYPSLPTLHQLMAALPLETQADRDHYLDMLGDYATFVLTLRQNFVDQAERGIRLPRPQIDSVAAYFRGFAVDPDKHPLQVNASRLNELEDADVEAFRARVAQQIRLHLNHAFEELADTFGPAYREQAPERVGVSQFPNGEGYYRYLIDLHVGTDLTPQQIHDIGLREVARLEQAMAEVRNHIGFKGDRAAFHAKLKADKRFFADTPAAVEAMLMKHHHRIEPLIGDYFSLVPKTEGRVARLDPALEASMTFGYYQWPTKADPRGTYFFNGSKLDERSLIQAQALIYHELIPGHHFQIALLYENKDLSLVRQNYFDTANVEGWAEYASFLADEMNLYTDPYDRYGRYLMDMFISVRLVVDTGMNAFGWSREKAAAYMAERTLRSDTEIASETLRYSVAIPGQALAYKLGSLKIKELRDWVETTKGDDFDIRAFHAAVLQPGSLPLPVLEQHIKTTFGE